MRVTVAAVVLLAASAGGAGCAFVGAHLPPGNAGPSFAEEPEGLPALSTNMRERRRTLDTAARSEVNGSFTLLEDLVRSSLALREQMRRAKERIDAASEETDDDDGESDGGVASSGLDRELLLEGAHWYIELDLLLYNLWTDYRRFLPYASEPDPYAPYRGASLLSRETRAKGGLVALAAEVVRMDNARVALEVLEGQWAIVQFLNRGDDERGIEPESFDRMVGAFHDPGRRSLLKAQLSAVKQERARLDALARADGQVAWLLSLLDDSEVAREIAGESSLGRQTRFAFAVAARSGVALLTPFLGLYIDHVLAEQRVEERPLRRLATVPGVRDALLDELAPMDVLVLRDEARAGTGAAYTHAVIHLGAYATLKASPAREHAAFASHRDQLRRGRIFLDVSQRGTRLVGLDDVLLSQDVAVLRYPLTPEDTVALQRQALDTLVEPDFVTPPQLEEREHAARLLLAVLGARLGVVPEQHGRPPALSAIAARALDADTGAQVVFSTLDGDVSSESERAAAIRRTLERQGPLDDVSVPSGP